MVFIAFMMISYLLGLSMRAMRGRSSYLITVI